ncbi:MAG TPA: hypothetical protein VHG28_11235 [Longimicrobiaceae bacterium]|nr:hypothetical protein [Longimicrobiaceae bacterium]
MPGSPRGRRVTLDDLAALTRPLVGLPVTRAWRGHGSCIVLEIGPLTGTHPRTGNPCADASIMVEWSWRVESRRAVRFGSWSTDRKISGGLASLTGRTVLDVGVEGRLPELSVALDGGVWLRSFMIVEGQPAWTVFLPDGSWLCVERGVLVHDTQNVPSPGE